MRTGQFRAFTALFASLLIVLTYQNCGPDFQASLGQSNSSVGADQPLPSDLNCEPGFHLEEESCVADTMACEVSNGVGQQVWSNGTWGACEVVSCQPGYQSQMDRCVFSPGACPINFGQGQTAEDGTCQAIACNSGFRLTNNQCVAIATATNPQWVPRSSARFFLTGHSLTDDPLASYIVNTAQSRGDTVAYNQQIVIGSPIRVRTRGSSSTGWTGYLGGKNRDGATGLNIISELRTPRTIGANQLYDTLIIAENHNSLDMIQWEDTIGFLRHYHDRLIEGNPSARSLFYNTWLGMNKSNPAPWIEFEKRALVAWECVASKVNHSLQAAGRNDRVLNLPVSGALVYLVEQIMAGQVPGISGSTLQRMNLIFSDDVHLTPLGVYYVSQVTYAAVYGKSPVGGFRPTGMSLETAQALQGLAWFYVNSYYSQPAPGVREMGACRDYIAQQVCPAYWGLKGNNNAITGCGNLFGGSNSPFRWPDPSFTPYPAP